MGISSNLGFPRMGVHRELKKALEAHWAGKLDERGLVSIEARQFGQHLMMLAS